jgi:hypothetical protein
VPDARQQQLDIRIAGILDPSVAAVIKKAEDGVKALGMSIKAQNAALSGVYNAAFAPPAEVQRSLDKIATFRDKLKDIGTIAAGVNLGSVLTQGMDFAIAKVEQFIGAMKSASDAAANMEIQKSNLAAATGLTGPQMEALQAYFWQKSIQVPVTVPTQMAGFKRIEEAITEADPSKRIAMGKAESDRLLDIAALAINPSQGGNIVEAINEKYRDVVDVVTKAQMYGIVNQRILSEFEGMGINLRPGMMLEKGLINQEQFSHWSSMPESERDALLGDFAKDVKKRQVFANIINDQIEQLTNRGGKAFGRAATIAGTTGGVESSSADVLNFFNTMIGQIENGPLKQLLSAINAGFASQIPQLTEMFNKMAVASDAGFKPIMAALQGADWARIGKDAGATLDGLEKMFQKAQPIFEWLGRDIPKEIDEILRITTAVEHVAKAIEKAFDWALNLGQKIGAATSVTAGDAVSTAQERLNALVSAGGERRTDISGQDSFDCRREGADRLSRELEKGHR